MPTGGEWLPRPVIKLGMTTWGIGTPQARTGLTPAETVAARYRGKLRELPDGGVALNTTANPSLLRLEFAIFWPSRQSERVLVANLESLGVAKTIPATQEWFLLTDDLRTYLAALEQQDNVREFNQRFPVVPTQDEWEQYQKERADG